MNRRSLYLGIINRCGIFIMEEIYLVADTNRFYCNAGGLKLDFREAGFF